MNHFLKNCACVLVAATTVSASGLPEVDAPRLIPLDESLISLSLHVRADAKTGGDGSVAMPFRFVQQAIDAAQKAAEPARILVAPGVYRETLNIAGSEGDASPLLVIEATELGRVVISGSDVFSDWKPVVDHAGRFSHPWKLKLGWEKNPWPGLMPMDARGFRHELLFLDGKPSRQVFEEADLREGTYYVDEEGKRILLQIAEGQTPAKLNVDVSVRPANDRGDHSKLVRVFKRDNVVFRGLVIRHGRSLSVSAAFQILGSSNLLIEDCRVEWNSGRGLAIETTGGLQPTNVVIRRTHCDDNGFAGMGGGFHDGLIEDVTTNRNNWRGVMFGATGWAPCGWKLSGLDRVVIRRMQSIGNHASGGWFDDHIENVVLEDFVGMNNLRAGLSVEAVEGPLIVRNAFLAGNSVGFNLFDSRNVALVESLIVDNVVSQVKLAGSLPMDPGELKKVKPDWRRYRLSKRQVPTNIILSENRIGITAAFATPEVRLLEFAMRDHVFVMPDGTHPLQQTLATLTSAGAVYAHVDPETASLFPDLNGRAIDFDAWKQVSAQDDDARFDMEALQAARAEAEKKVGVSIDPYRAPDPIVPPSSTADELEL